MHVICCVMHVPGTIRLYCNILGRPAGGDVACLVVVGKTLLLAKEVPEEEILLAARDTHALQPLIVLTL